jgi:hypothetical protein
MTLTFVFTKEGLFDIREKCEILVWLKYTV